MFHPSRPSGRHPNDPTPKGKAWWKKKETKKGNVRKLVDFWGK